MVAICLFRVLLGQRLTPTFRYYLWLVLMARLLLPVLPTSPFSLFRWTPWQSWPSAPGGDLAGSAATASFPWPTLLLIIYGCGVVALLLYYLISYFRLRRRVRYWLPVTEPSSQALLATCCQQLGIVKKCRLVAGETPLLLGWKHPYLSLPAGYSLEEQRTIITHELVHYKRRDVVLNVVAACLCCLYWFHPLVWLAMGRMRRDCELACDQRVIQLLAGGGRKVYAQSLFKAAMQQNRYTVGAEGLARGEKEVANRVRFIATFQQPAKAWTAGGLVLAVVLAVACLTNTTALGKETLAEAFPDPQPVLTVEPAPAEVQAADAVTEAPAAEKTPPAATLTPMAEPAEEEAASVPVIITEEGKILSYQDEAGERVEYGAEAEPDASLYGAPGQTLYLEGGYSYQPY